jgi:TetR/AcrR family transcriptional regulator, fatty acid metabolism regulator protein
MVDMLKGHAKVKTEIRREQITQAVFDIIAADGLGGLTTSAIARNVGVSEANLYRHFKNKNEILISAVNKIGNGLFHNLESVQSKPMRKPLFKLKTLFALHLKFIENNRGIPRFVYSQEMHRGNDLRGRLLKIINLYMHGIELLIKEGQAKGTVNNKIDARTLALTIIGMIQVITLRWSLNDFSFSLADEGMKHWKNFERCISTQ